VPATRLQRGRVKVGSRLPWRRMYGTRTVVRHVQGVDLHLPWAHLLPDYARARPSYGQNLVELADGLHRRQVDGPLRVLDIGANIGDSALQIMGRTDARVLCVEADPYWAAFLRTNLKGDVRAIVEEALLVPSEGEWTTASPVRNMGTTRFTQDAEKLGALPAISAQELRRRHPEFEQLRLIKSDTDGFDPILVPAVAAVWNDHPPVLFFEFDPGLARTADDRDPNSVWEKLGDLGYTRLAIWDNTGDPLGQLATVDAPGAAAGLEPRPVHLGYDFWDVAAWHCDDGAASDTCNALMPEAYSELGTWR
jgi:FkbM family methyltransferase